jgi:hypothetical protein
MFFCSSVWTAPAQEDEARSDQFVSKQQDKFRCLENYSETWHQTGYTVG